MESESIIFPEIPIDSEYADEISADKEIRLIREAVNIESNLYIFEESNK